MIQAFGLTSNPRKAHPPAVDDVSLEAPAGQVTALLGGAGAGKTTALRLMLELQPGRGITYFRGRPLHRIAHPSREVGVLLGDVPGHPARTVRGHLRMLCAASGVPARRADEVLEVVGLVSFREERLGTLSRGMDRRLGLAGALLSDPHTLVLDAPADGLSAREAQWLHSMLRAHAKQGGTVLYTTADPKEAARAADRVVALDGGRVVADQDAREFARTRLRPHVAVRSPHAARLAALLAKEARTGRRSVEVVCEGGNRLSVYGSTTADVGETAFRHGILVHQLADEVGGMGPAAGPGAGFGADSGTRAARRGTPAQDPQQAVPEPGERDAAASGSRPAERERAPFGSSAPETGRETLTASPARPGRVAVDGAPPERSRTSVDDAPAGYGPPAGEPAAPAPGTATPARPAAATPAAPASARDVSPAGEPPVTGGGAAHDAVESPAGTSPAEAIAPAGDLRPADAAPESHTDPAGNSPRPASRTGAGSPGPSLSPEPHTGAVSGSPAGALATRPRLPGARVPGTRRQQPDRAADPDGARPRDAHSLLPPPISVRTAPTPLRPLRYEIRRAAGIGTGFVTCGAVLVVSALTAVVLARLGHTPQARLFAAWPRQLPLPPAALAAGLLGALAFGDEFRHPALAADRGTVPRRLGLLAAKLFVSGATALLLAFLTVGCDAEVLYVVYGRELTQLPGDWLALCASWFGLVVGCAWAGVLAAGVFRSTTAGLAAVLAVPVLVVPVVHQVLRAPGAHMAAGFPVRMREVLVLQWPFGGERYLVAAVRVLAQPVGGALALSLTGLLCAYLLTTLRTRVR
ncbi:ABC transporter [Streptomyces lucensis JCM 4490]|uniref:ABC transporter n=1 Tax=Streptomyces lucensis JCM 4490 TaxID=1306176 RepID=A0A918JAU2_9ACTN|nr:ATP-binding cassette domain-containing protein [Streptomyces lucensis]GGW69555.1 ABC transporter [Streptomyces lucensis JCM 4490]